MKNKNILIIGILLLVVLQIGGVLAQVEVPKIENAEGVIIDYEGENVWTISFTGDKPFADIQGNKYENILSADKSLHPSYIKIDNLGKILEADLTADEKGGDYLINGVKIHLNSGERVYYNQKENKYYLDKNTAITGIDDSALEKGFFIKGQQIKLPDNSILNGEATLQKNGYLIEKGGMNYKRLKLAVLDEPVLIAREFFDLRDYKDNYVSFLKNDLVFEGPLMIELKKDNPYIKTEGENYITLISSSNSKVILNNRDSQGLIPKLTLSGDSLSIKESVIGSFFDEENIKRDSNIWDSYEIDYSGKEGKFVLKRPEISGATTPLEIVSSDSKANEKIFIAKFGRIAVAPKNINTEYISKSNGIDVGFSSRIKYNYLTEESLELISGIPLEFKGIDAKNKERILLDLRDSWNNLNPETKKAIKEIKIGDYFYDVFGRERENSAASSNLMDGSLVLREGVNNNVFRHEAAHLRNADIRRESFITALPDFLNFPSINKKINLFYGISSPFDKEWEDVAGEYSKVIEDENKEWRYVDGGFDIPKYGYIRPYGGSNIDEDVAMFVEKVNEPEFFKLLINPSSKEYDKRYKQKLDLLYQYKFISPKEYNTILKEAGVK